MRTDVDVVVDTSDGVADGVPQAIETLAYDTTMLSRRPFPRLRTARGTTEVQPREGSDGVPTAIRHEDDDVCVGLWCDA